MTWADASYQTPTGSDEAGGDNAWPCAAGAASAARAAAASREESRCVRDMAGQRRAKTTKQIGNRGLLLRLTPRRGPGWVPVESGTRAFPSWRGRAGGRPAFEKEHPILALSRVRAAAAVALISALAPAAAAHAEDATVASFDGTPIVVHFFPAPGLGAGQAAPTILNGPGWAGAGETDPTKSPVKELNAAGYNVVTWAPRGFGASGGLVSIDAPSVEGRDVSAIIDAVARQPWAQLDGPGDPRVGMTGGSYGAAIQYATALNDRRVDALVPVVGWHNLETSLYRDKTFKQTWDTLLYLSGMRAADATPPGMDPHFTAAFEQGMRTGVLSPADERWFAARGPGDAVG